jgi:ABC-2 type transport system permease protein
LEFHKLITTRLWLWLLLASVAITALYASLDIAFSDHPGTWTLPLSTPQGHARCSRLPAAPRR